VKRRRGLGSEEVLAVLSPLALLVLWQVLAMVGIIDQRYFPAPLRIFGSGEDLVRSGELPVDIMVTLYRLACGFLLGAAPGILLGMIMGLNRTVRIVVDPLIAALYPIPKVAILPLFMLVFGIGDGSKIAVVAFTVFFLAAINTLAGVVAIEPILLDVARNFDAPGIKLFRRVILPAILPTIFTGLRISLGVSLIVLVSAEFVASDDGIGYLIWSSWQTLVVENMFVGIITITILGVLSTMLLKGAERRLVPWRHTHD
jgi:ABC-type nitrate/sulfonate/bicarbonate transport system permease component